MDDKKLLTCRLCLKRIELRSSDYQLIDKIERQILEVLLIDIDLSITKQPIVCNDCMAQLHQCFDFKATCLYTEDYIFPLVDPDNINKVELKEIFVNQIKVEDKMSVINKICRFCMKQIDNWYFVTLDNTNENIFIKDVLQKHFPELDSTSIHDFVSCENCFDSLRKAFDFINSCLDIEETVKMYQEINRESGTKPFDLAQIELYDRKEDIHNCVDLGMDNLDINDNKSGILQDLEYIEHVKTETDWETTQTCMESLQDVKPSPQQTSEQKKQRSQTTITKKLKNDVYECETCGYKTGYKSSIAAHMLIHRDPSEITMYKCDICPFKTKYSGSISHHKSLHSEAGKKHKCSVCNYRTTRVTYLERHMIKHNMNPSDMQLYRCMECSFETKHKESLRNHVVIHKNFGIYKCAQCDYQTKHRRYLTAHVGSHKDSPKISTYKCKVCTFEAKTKTRLDKHMVIHKDL